MRSTFLGSLGPRFSLRLQDLWILNLGVDCGYVSVVQVRSKSHPAGPGKMGRANCGGRGQSLTLYSAGLAAPLGLTSASSEGMVDTATMARITSP